MATLEQLGVALQNAHAAGDTAAAKTLAGAIISMRAQQANTPAPAEAPQAGDSPILKDTLSQLSDLTQHPAVVQDGSLSADNAVRATATGVPIIGGLLNKLDAATNATLAPVVDPMLPDSMKKLNGDTWSDRYNQALDIQQGKDKAFETAHPYVDTGLQVAGGLGALAPLGATAIGGRVLGLTGPAVADGAGLLTRAGALGSRVAASAGSGAVISGADTAARGGDATDVVNSTLVGGGIGGAVPALGAVVGGGLKWVGGKIAPRLNSIINPADEAARRVGNAVERDTVNNPVAVMNAGDEAMAAQANVPLVNADRGGEVTRALARSVANQSPEARAVIEKTASDRFGGQSQRAVDFVRDITPGRADDIALQQQVKSTAAIKNKANYDLARSDPAAQSIFTPGIQDLMQSPSFRSAVDSVPTKSADRGAVQGFKEIGNPFTQNSQGAYVLKQKADGTLVSPNLDFWNQVKINLDGEIGKAKRAGDNSTASDLMGLKGKLVEDLDTAVPAYQTARQGAFQAFNAEDAIEAGKNFANQPRLIPEAAKAIAKMSDTEKSGFATGFGSELIDKIKTSGDRTNVINSTFKNQASREQMNLVFGPEKAKQIEAYVRVEDLADRLRGAMGNSTTARQLAEMGLGATGGAYMGSDGGVTGMGLGAAAGALAARGGRALAVHADAKTMQEVANLLTQDNPLALKSAVTRAAKNPAYMTALDRIGSALAVPSRAVTPLVLGQQAKAPLQIDVRPAGH